jgi:hypothetical protein
MPILACVLECSSISAMIFLAIFVVITRVGVNKEPLAEPYDPDRQSGAAQPNGSIEPTPDTIQP